MKMYFFCEIYVVSENFIEWFSQLASSRWDSDDDIIHLRCILLIKNWYNCICRIFYVICRRGIVNDVMSYNIKELIRLIFCIDSRLLAININIYFISL